MLQSPSPPLSDGKDGPHTVAAILVIESAGGVDLAGVDRVVVDCEAVVVGAIALVASGAA